MAQGGVLERVLKILACFDEDSAELTASELADQTGIARSTSHRLINTLVRRGMLVRVPHHRYAVGPRLWELGELSPLSLRLRERALPHLIRLYEITGENVHLAVLDGDDPTEATALFVGRVTGRKSVPTVSRAGSREPLHATGVGKALLSQQREAWLKHYFSVPRERETEHTVVDEDTLRHELTRAKSRGYATTKEEMTLGNISVAVPLPPIAGLPPIAIGLVVPIPQADEHQLSAVLKQLARDIARDVRATSAP